jgi:hypothetical protein
LLVFAQFPSCQSVQHLIPSGFSLTRVNPVGEGAFDSFWMQKSQHLGYNCAQ